MEMASTFGSYLGKYLKLLINHASGIQKLIFKEDEFRNCKVYLKSKSTHLGHNGKRKRAERKLEVISSDIMGAFTSGSKGEKFVASLLTVFQDLSLQFSWKPKAK